LVSNHSSGVCNQTGICGVHGLLAPNHVMVVIKQGQEPVQNPALAVENPQIQKPATPIHVVRVLNCFRHTYCFATMKCWPAWSGVPVQINKIVDLLIHVSLLTQLFINVFAYPGNCAEFLIVNHCRLQVTSNARFNLFHWFVE